MHLKNCITHFFGFIQSALGIFIDFGKAFDTVQRKILLNKLQQVGIRGQENKWFESYLKDRSQFIQILNSKSQHAM